MKGEPGHKACNNMCVRTYTCVCIQWKSNLWSPKDFMNNKCQTNTMAIRSKSTHHN